ncbi:TIGR02117 family protein [Chitinophaga pendula]|uniref:TIGR02117 family protein n=1 Tax=Chitinophaga TaxID=79328 RepID=UPI000BB06B47|nr:MULTISPECIES: TIGR02117 family protein [Chitinophaga]ASZ09885.1 TIGR02117 family protein [Chitinophaga sp. MD30]UCJ07174.1 TIGR02117 family protein [Chitinophaga pendula]
MHIRLKKSLKYTGFTLLALLLAVILYLLAAFGLSAITVAKEGNTAEEVPIYLLTNGVHTDLVVPVWHAACDWSQFTPFENTLARDSSASYVAFGWGDKGFYLHTPTWADLTFATAFKAAFNLSSAAMHVTYYHPLLEDSTCKRLFISNEQYARLVTYIKSAFTLDSSGHTILIPTDAVYGRTDAFYEAKGSYNLFYTCNTWANNGLKACGQTAAWWTPFDTGIFRHYK